MVKFKDYISSDLENVFINTNEFGEEHNINGKPMNIIIDNDWLKERSKKEYDGISVSEILFFVKEKDFGEKPKIGAPLTFNKKLMYVFDAREDDGLYEIILHQNRGE